MSLVSFVTRPVRTITDAIVMPFKAVFVVGLCWVINAMTYSGTWWVKWVALGMVIATVVAIGRAAKTLIVLALVAWAGVKIYQRYGQAAREGFEDWVAKTQPDAAGVLAVLRSPRPAANAGTAKDAAPLRRTVF